MGRWHTGSGTVHHGPANGASIGLREAEIRRQSSSEKNSDAKHDRQANIGKLQLRDEEVKHSTCLHEVIEDLFSVQRVCDDRLLL